MISLKAKEKLYPAMGTANSGPGGRRAPSHARGDFSCVIYRQVFWLKRQTRPSAFPGKIPVTSLKDAPLTQQRHCAGFTPASLSSPGGHTCIPLHIRFQNSTTLYGIGREMSRGRIRPPPRAAAGGSSLPPRPSTWNQIYPSAHSSSASSTAPPAAPRSVLWLRHTNL